MVHVVRSTVEDSPLVDPRKWGARSASRVEPAERRARSCRSRSVWCSLRDSLPGPNLNKSGKTQFWLLL